MPGRIDYLNKVRGDTVSFTYLCRERDAEGELVPRDITDHTFTVTLKLYAEQTDAEAGAQVSKTVTGQIGLDGLIILSIPASVTTTLLPTRYVYDLQMESPNGEVSTLLLGSITFVGDVTRSVLP